MWVVILLVVIAVIGMAVHLKGEESNNMLEPPKIPWRNPSSAEEHLIFFAIMAEAISTFDLANFSVSYTWRAGMDDRVSLTFYGIDSTLVFEETEAWKYLRTLGTTTAELEYTFESAKGGAPGCFRGNNAVLEFIRPFAPNGFVAPSSSGDYTWIQFSEHELQAAYLNTKIDETIMKAFQRFR